MKSVRIFVLNLVDLVQGEKGRIVNIVFATRDFFLAQGFGATIPGKGTSAVTVIDLFERQDGPSFDDYFTLERIEELVETRNMTIKIDGLVYGLKPEEELIPA
jgi:hypothetical protein